MLTHGFNGALKRFSISRQEATVQLTVRRGRDGGLPKMHIDCGNFLPQFEIKREGPDTLLLIHEPPEDHEPLAYLLITADYVPSDYGYQPEIVVKFRADESWTINWPDRTRAPRTPS